MDRGVIKVKTEREGATSGENSGGTRPSVKGPGERIDNRKAEWVVARE